MKKVVNPAPRAKARGFWEKYLNITLHPHAKERGFTGSGVKISLVAVFIFFGIGVYLYQNYTVPILMYHSLDGKKVQNYAAVSPEVFYKQMRFIKVSRLKVLSLSDYCRMLKDNKSIPRDSVVITFDDGYKDNLAAIEILKEFSYPVTFFLIVNKVGEGEYLSKDDIEMFIENTKAEVGSHTLSHRYLPEMKDTEAQTEIHNSKINLEEMFSRSITTVSYPLGGFDEKILKEAEDAGYLCGCTTNRGFSPRLNRFALRRIKITNRDLGFRLWVKLSGFYNLFKAPKKPY